MNIKKQKLEKEEQIPKDRIIKKNFSFNLFFNFPYWILRCNKIEIMAEENLDHNIFKYIKFNFLNMSDLWNCFRAFTFSKEEKQIYSGFNDICTFCWKNNISEDMKTISLLKHHNGVDLIRRKKTGEIRHFKGIYACFKCYSNYAKKRVYIDFE